MSSSVVCEGIFIIVHITNRGIMAFVIKRCLSGLVILLERVALGAQRPIVVKLSRERSVGRSVCPSVYSALWKNGGSDPYAVWHHGSRDEAGSRVWGSVHEKGYF